MTIDATSKLMTKNAAVIFYYAASISRRRSYQSSSIVEGQFCQRDLCDGSHRIRRSITGGKDHQWRDRASLMCGLPNQLSVLIASLRRYAELGSVRLLKDELEARRIDSRSWTNASGRLVGGKPFSRALYLILQNRIS